MNIAADELPPFVIAAEVPAETVVTVPTEIVAAEPVGPVAPWGPGLEPATVTHELPFHLLMTFYDPPILNYTRTLIQIPSRLKLLNLQILLSLKKL